MRPDAQAARLVLRDHVHVTWRSDDMAAGVVRGREGWYRVKQDPVGNHCTCPNGQAHEAGRASCSHVQALSLQLRLDALRHQDDRRRRFVEKLFEQAGYGRKENRR